MMLLTGNSIVLMKDAWITMDYWWEAANVFKEDSVPLSL
jgi:hypothetical protein